MSTAQRPEKPLADRIMSLRTIASAFGAIAAVAALGAFTWAHLVTRDDMQAAIAAHASSSSDQVAATPAVKSIAYAVGQLGQRVSSVEATSRDTAADLEWIKGALFQLAQRQRIAVTPPPKRRAK